jgi:GNAT superfamily N-acetyltransferase
MSVVRRLREADLDAALELSNAAGWNQTAADWRRVLALEPEGCFGVEAGGRLAATATAVCHGTELAWIGMVLTHPEARRQGHARRAMEAALEWLDGLGVKGSRLDATDMGQPLYEQLGYRVECEVQRWKGEGRGGKAEGEQGVPNLLLDREATGTDRSKVLESLAGSGCVRALAGFIMHRPGRVAHYLGPCLAESEEEAVWLVEQAVNGIEGPVYWDLPVENESAARLAGRFGFSPVRRLQRMARGQAPPEKRQLIYALSGFETG